MKIRFESKIIPLPAEKVFSYFDEHLFKALNPWFMPMKVELFEGCLPGNRVIVALGGSIINTRWISEITSFENNENEIFFTDIGIELPFPLKKWEHHHRIIKTGDRQCRIVDEITYFTSQRWLDQMIKPAILMQFGVRKKAYSNYFRKISGSKI